MRRGLRLGGLRRRGGGRSEVVAMWLLGAWVFYEFYEEGEG